MYHQRIILPSEIPQVGPALDPTGPRPMTDEELLNIDLRRLSGNLFEDGTVDWTPTRELHARRPGTKVQGSEGVALLRYTTPSTKIRSNFVKVLRRANGTLGLRRRIVTYLTNQLGHAPTQQEVLTEARARMTAWLLAGTNDPNPYPDLRMVHVAEADVDSDDIVLSQVLYAHKWNNEPT